MSKSYTGIIKIEYVEIEDGGISIFPEQKAVEATVARLKKSEQAEFEILKAQESSYEPPAPHLRQSAIYERTLDDMRDLAGNRLKERTFPFRPYTGGERTEAKRAATTYLADGGTRFDEDLFRKGCVCAATGLDSKDFDDLPSALQDELVGRVFSRTSIDPTRLDFFV